MSRPRSIRPRKAPRSQQLATLARLLGRPDPGLLEAALEPGDAQTIQERAKDQPAEALLATAISVCLEAHELWQRMTTAERTHVRGFSLQLLGLASDQALALERGLIEYTALSAEHSTAVAELRDLVPRAALLSAQAANVLEKVAGESKACEEGSCPVVPNTTFALAQTLHRLAHTGLELVRSANVAVRRRAVLYGLNDAFIEGLAAAGRELVNVNEKACGTGPLDESRRRLDRSRCATFLLVTQIAEAFATARKIDPAILPLSAVSQKTRGVEPIVRRTIDVPFGRDKHGHDDYGRDKHLVVVTVEEPRQGTPIAALARATDRMIVPAKTTRGLEFGDLEASGMIRKKSKPPSR